MKFLSEYKQVKDYETKDENGEVKKIDGYKCKKLTVEFDDSEDDRIKFEKINIFLNTLEEKGAK